MTSARSSKRELWARVRTCLPAVDGLTIHDDHFFGGAGATIDMNFAVGVFDAGLVVHVGTPTAEDERAGARPVTIDGQHCPGWVRVPPAAVVDDDVLAAWVHRGVERAQSLPRYDRSGWPERICIGFAPNTGARAFGVYEEEDPAVTRASASRIRLAPDYSATLPLWGRGLARFDVDDLDASLLDELRAWQVEFDREFDHQRGWSSDLARRRWSATAIELEEKLRAALLRWAELEVDLWPLDR